MLEHDFRQDEVAISGPFSGSLHLPESDDLRDNYPTSEFASESARVAWNSPKYGTGFFEGWAEGSGQITVFSAGARRVCADYSFRDTGRVEFTVDASASNLRVVSSTVTSTAYTSFIDRLNGQCDVPNPPPSRFFGGNLSQYDGTFEPSDHTIAIEYDGTSPTANVSVPPTSVKWPDGDPMDLELEILPSEIAIPNGWTHIVSNASPDDIDIIDLAHGLELRVDVSGAPVTVTNVLDPVATVRLFWASSADDTLGEEIPVTSNQGPLGVFWNSSGMHAIIDDFPPVPNGATHVRVAIDAIEGADSNEVNSTKFLRIESFQADDPDTGAVSEDVQIADSTNSVLSAEDRADPAIDVLAYNDRSALGARVEVFDDSGRFVYDPREVAAIQALAPGETATDYIHFLATKYGTLSDQATRTVTLTGVNDRPSAGDDVAATTTQRNAVLPVSDLLANDADIDHNDSITFNSADPASSLGATVSIEFNEAGTEAVGIVYDPCSSSTLAELPPGEQIEDSFTYEIIDRNGSTDTAKITIGITGEEPIAIAPVPTQFTTVDSLMDAIALTLSDADGDASELQLSVESSHPDVVPPENLVLTGSGSSRWLAIQPAAGVHGRTRISVTASDGVRCPATQRFSVIVGLEEDLDLDGVPNEEEDAAPNGGDMNNDGQPDRLQADVASVRAHGSDAYFNLVVPEMHWLSGVSTKANPEPSGVSGNAQIPLGLIAYEVLLETPGEATTIELRSDSTAPALNRYFRHDDSDANGQVWHDGMRWVEGARVFSDRIELRAIDGGIADKDGGQNSRIIGEGAPAHVERPWQNLVHEDVNNDGIVSPIDVLIIISALHNGGVRPLGELPTGDDSIPSFLDTSGDAVLSSADVLEAIDFLNRTHSNGGEGEHERAEFAGPILPVVQQAAAGAHFLPPGTPPTRPESADAIWSHDRQTPRQDSEALTFQRVAHADSPTDSVFSELIEDFNDWLDDRPARGGLRELS
jgi:VCBS repeat-containing protein